LDEGVRNVYSHQIAAICGATAARVRRDLMVIGYTGSPIHGYAVKELIESIDLFLDSPEGQRVALVGVGNLGLALLAYFTGRRPKLSIVAAFDKDPEKVNRVVHGCRSYPLSQLREVVGQQRLEIGIITVPAGEAQTVAELLVESGVRGIVNFAPAPLQVPPHVYVEELDVTQALEKAAYFARKSRVGELKT